MRLGRIWTGLQALAICAALIGIAACASTSSPARSTERVLVEVPLNRPHAATPLVVPVHFNGRTHDFVLDTGSTITIFDSQFRPLLGERVDVQQARTGSGVMEIDMYDAPDARLGSMSLRMDTPVACVDLTAYRGTVKATSGHNVLGIVGMDFLRNYRLRLDFDSGTVTVLEPGSGDLADWGQPIPLEYKAKGIPAVVASLPDGTSASFVVDTGEAATGDLREEIYASLREAGYVTGGRRVSCATSSGFHELEEGVVSCLILGPHRHESLPMFRSNWNGLGLSYLSRFNVLFDFPEKRLYLKPRSSL